MEIYSKIKQLVDQKQGCSISKLEKELGFGSGTIRKWQKQMPSIDKVYKVSQYFNVPIGTFVEEDKEDPSVLNSDIITYKFNERMASLDLNEQDRQYLLDEFISYIDFKAQFLEHRQQTDSHKKKT